MKNSAYYSIHKAPRQERHNAICATCTHNCKQAPVAQLVRCPKYTDRRTLIQDGGKDHK